MSAESEKKIELSRLVHMSARYLDDHDYDAYLQLFSSDGSYCIKTKAPELPEPMTWMLLTRDELAERIKAMTEHEWEIALIEQTRIISVDKIELNNTEADFSSSFALFHTGQSGASSCYAVGRYNDKWEQSNGAWLLAKREVVLKTRQLTMLSPLPI